LADFTEHNANTRNKSQPRAKWRRHPANNPPTQQHTPSQTLTSIEAFPPADRRCALRDFLSLLDSTLNHAPRPDFHDRIIKTLARLKPSLSPAERQSTAAYLQKAIHHTAAVLQIEHNTRDSSRTHFLDHPPLFNRLIQLILSLIQQLHMSGHGTHQKQFKFVPIPSHEIKKLADLIAFFSLEYDEEIVFELERDHAHLLESIADIFISFGSLFADLFLCSTTTPEEENHLSYEPPRPSPYNRKRKKKQKPKGKR